MPTISPMATCTPAQGTPGGKGPSTERPSTERGSRGRNAPAKRGHGVGGWGGVMLRAYRDVAHEGGPEELHEDEGEEDDEAQAHVLGAAKGELHLPIGVAWDLARQHLYTVTPSQSKNASGQTPPRFSHASYRGVLMPAVYPDPSQGPDALLVWDQASLGGFLFSKSSLVLLLTPSSSPESSRMRRRPSK